MVHRLKNGGSGQSCNLRRMVPTRPCNSTQTADFETQYHLTQAHGPWDGPTKSDIAWKVESQVKVHILSSIADAATSSSRAVRKGDLHVDEISFFGFHSLAYILVILHLFGSFVPTVLVIRSLLNLSLARHGTVTALVVAVAAQIPAFRHGHTGGTCWQPANTKNADRLATLTEVIDTDHSNNPGQTSLHDVL